MYLDRQIMSSIFVFYYLKFSFKAGFEKTKIGQKWFPFPLLCTVSLFLGLYFNFNEPFFLSPKKNRLS